jgi:hypothetical protein
MLAGGPAVLPELALLTVLLVAAEVRPALAGVLALGFVVGPVAAAAPEVTLPPDGPGCADASNPKITQSTAVVAMKRKANWQLKFVASILFKRRTILHLILIVNDVIEPDARDCFGTAGVPPATTGMTNP